jgi:hypothetical protein
VLKTDLIDSRAGNHKLLGLLVNLLDTQAEADAEIIRLREGWVAHVFAVPLAPAWAVDQASAHSSADSARVESCISMGRLARTSDSRCKARRPPDTHE